MAKTSCSAAVPAAAEVVWETLARFEDISRWGTGVSESSMLTQANEGLGATRRVQVGRNTLRETITVWQPQRSLGYSIVGLPPVVRQAGNTWTLAAEGDGTRVTLTSEVVTKGGPLLGRLVAGRIGKANKQLLAGLVSHLGTGIVS
jgi:hypothetical protein